MQYLLTQDEMNALVPKDEVAQRDLALAAAREKILDLAGFHCIHKPSPNPNRGGYCDDCPCSQPANNWEKKWDRVCWSSKRYSQ